MSKLSATISLWKSIRQFGAWDFRRCDGLDFLRGLWPECAVYDDYPVVAYDDGQGVELVDPPIVSSMGCFGESLLWLWQRAVGMASGWSADLRACQRDAYPRRAVCSLWSASEGAHHGVLDAKPGSAGRDTRGEESIGAESHLSGLVVFTLVLSRTPARRQIRGLGPSTDSP